LHEHQHQAPLLLAIGIVKGLFTDLGDAGHFVPDPGFHAGLVLIGMARP